MQLLKNNLCQGFDNDISQLLLRMTMQQCHNSILSQIMKEMENNINMFALTVYDNIFLEFNSRNIITLHHHSFNRDMIKLF